MGVRLWVHDGSGGGWLAARRLEQKPAAETVCRVLVCICVKVIAWTEQQDGTWQMKLVHNFGAPVWKVSWSVAGNILAVSDANNAVSLWKETLDGVWQQVVQ